MNDTVREDANLVVFVPANSGNVAIEICVNFGIFAGRPVMHSEIDRLATWLLDEVEAITVIAEERHEIGRTARGSIHQVRVEVSEELAPRTSAERRELEDRLIERLDYWARVCLAERHDEPGLA